MLTGVCVTTAVWTTLYILSLHIFGQSPEWCCRIVTLLHGTLVTVLATLDWSYLHPCDFKNLGQPNTFYQETVIAISLGYFIFDFVWVLKYQGETAVMYLHHVASIICLSYIYFSGVSACEALISVSILEGTNPCLQIRWFLRTHGYQGTPIHVAVELIFMLSFLLLRCLAGSYLTWKIFIHGELHPFFKVGTISLYVVSLIFVGQMLMFTYKKYVAKKRCE